MVQKITSHRILNSITELKNLAIELEASKELKLEILDLYKNYNLSYLNNKTIDKKTVLCEIETIKKAIDKIKTKEIVCPDTKITIKTINTQDNGYIAVETNGFCCKCLKSKHYTCFPKLQKGSWPVTFVGRGVVCNECLNKKG